MDRAYVLRSMYGQTLPFVLHATADGDTTQLVEESIVLEASGRATSTAVVRTVIDGGPATVHIASVAR